MARTRGQKGYFDFSRGIVTEGSKLTYEENSLLDSMNMTFSPGKPLRKRLGQFSGVGDSVSISDTGTYTPAEASPGVVGKWLWRNAGGRAQKDVFVFMDGNVLVGMEGLAEAFKIDLLRYDYQDKDDSVDDGLALSDSEWVVSLARFSAVGNNLYAVIQCEKLGSSFGEITSRLIRVRFPNLQSRGLFTAYVADILPVKYRDFGDASTVQNEVGIDMNRAASMWTDPDSPYVDQEWYAIYDMFNRGWTHLYPDMYQQRGPVQDSLKYVFRGNPPILGYSPAPPLQFHKQYAGKWPNKAMIPSLGVTSGIFDVGGTGAYINRAWDVDPYRTTNFGSGSAPKGHVICDIHRENSRGHGMEFLLSNGGSVGDFSYSYVDGPDPDNLTSIATFFGRVVLGTESGKVMMSQLQKDSSNDFAGKCYQEQDPTDKDFNELLATDGAVVDIGAAGSVISLVPFAGKLLVITTNGIWSIGGAERSYDITSIGVDQLYNEGVTDDSSVVSFPGGVVMFSDSGIIMVTRDQTVGTLSVQNISDESIKSLFEDVYKGNEVTAAVYDPTNARIEWFFGDSMLQLDTRTGGFFRHQFGKAVDFAVKMPTTFVAPVSEIVTVGGVAVTVGGEDVTVDATTTEDAPDSGLLYYSLDVTTTENADEYGSVDLTRTYLVDESLYDMDVLNYEAYAIAGYDTMNDPSADKDIDRAFFWFDVTEDGVTGSPGNYVLENQSACDLSVKWEWSTTGEANRWYNIGNVYEIPVQYTIDDGPPATLNMPYDVSSVTRDIPGQGKSVLFRFEAQEGKHMSIWGWAVTASSEVNP